MNIDPKCIEASSKECGERNPLKQGSYIQKLINNMKQGEQTTHTLGTGALIIRECSNGTGTNPDQHKLPRLTMVLPEETYVQNEGCSDAIVVREPARSLQLEYQAAKQLYAALKSYFEP